MKSTLYQKGLRVIGSLLAIQLLLLAGLNFFLAKAESLADQALQNAAVVGRSNWVSTLLCLSGMSSVAYATTGDQQWKAIFDGAVARLLPEANELAAVFGRGTTSEFSELTEKQRAEVQAVREEIQQIASLLQKTSAQKPPIDRAHLQAMLTVKLLPLAENLYTIRSDLLLQNNNWYRQDQVENNRPRARETRNFLFAVMIVVDVLGALIVFWLYTKGLTNRLTLLQENTGRMVRRETLHPPVPGTDEIADLDRVFHDMVNSLRLAEKRKQEFVAMISHDLRTPLTSVHGALEMVVESNPELDESSKKWLGRASVNVDTILSLINELLEYDRIESGMLVLQYDEFDVGSLIDKSVQSVIDIAAKKGIKIETPESDVRIEADQERLQRVLVNLLGNAIKFSRRNTVIKVELKRNTNTIDLSVSDQGRGIPQDRLDKVFDSYSQVSVEDATKLGGAGLGLAITKAIVEAHGGSISVSSELDVGTTFTISLPLSAAAQKASL